jgi:hypothetical protein
MFLNRPCSMCMYNYVCLYVCMYTRCPKSRELKGIGLVGEASGAQ